VPPPACNRLEYFVPLTPDGKDDVVIASANGVTASVNVTDFVCGVGLDESATLKVKLVELLAVGCPEMIPVDAARLSPAGRLPELTVQVYLPLPPVALSVAL
jgi:hypothetical protein